MPDTRLILTVIGDDRPGLVEELAIAISTHGGNWLEASMSQLSGKFAGIVEVAVPAAEAAELKTTLSGLKGLKVSVESAAAQKSALAGRRLSLNLVGHDRIGIVREVSQVLASHAVNVEDLQTRTSSAPMSAEILFHCEAELTASPDFNARELKAALEKLSDDLMVEIKLGEML
ncbi:MAG: ACT domain-containing protein [Rhodocyclaceae bacterium]|nr:ACT domain-containing protein [Rhodocyclaceae bacterium]MDZ4213363.1 ACT domain-containing protein [Rhodocyclaceae bacterium]